VYLTPLKSVCKRNSRHENYPISNYTTTNRSMIFNWTGFDNENDNLTYDVEVLCHPLCSDDDRVIYNINDTYLKLSVRGKTYVNRGNHCNRIGSESCKALCILYAFNNWYILK